jgi:hypothetical protein
MKISYPKAINWTLKQYGYIACKSSYIGNLLEIYWTQPPLMFQYCPRLKSCHPPIQK